MNAVTTPPVGTPPEKPAKAEKEKKEPTVRRSKFAEIYPDDAKISILTEKNPKKEGSAANERYELYKEGGTVKAFIDAGGTYQDIAYNVGRAFIKIT